MHRASAQFKQVNKGLTQSAQGFQQFGGQLRSVGMSMTAGITLPLVALGAGASKAAIDFESSFAGIRKTMDLTESEFRELAQANRDLAKTIPVSVNELNKIGELAGQLGIRGVSNVLKFEDTIAKLAVTTDLTAEQGALAFAQIANVMQLPQDQIDRLGAAVVDLGNNFATTESRIVDFTQRIGGAGKIAGLTMGDVTGIGTAFASLGIEAQMGGTAVQKVLISMLGAVNKGGAELETFAGVAGMSAGDFATAFREDAAGAFADFVEGLGRQGDAAIGTLEDLGLQDQRLIRAFLGAAGAGDLLRNAIERGNAAFASNTALSEEATKRFETMRSRLTVLWNRIKDVAITLGGSLAPAMNTLVDLSTPLIGVVARMAQGFADLPKPIQVVTAAFAALIAATPLLVLGIGNVINMLANLALVANTAIGAKALAGLGAMLVAGGPIVAGGIAAAGAIALVVAVLTKTGREAKAAREELERFRDSLGQPVTIDMVRDFNVNEALAAVKVADLKDAIDEALDVGDVRLAQELRGKLEDAEAELARFSFRAGQIGKLKVETQATVQADIDEAEAELDTILSRIRGIEEGKITVEPAIVMGGAAGERAAADARQAELDRLNSQASEVSSRLNELDSDLKTFTQSATDATAAAASSAPTIYTEDQLAEMREQASIAARIRGAVVSAERDFFERRFRNPDFSDIGGQAFDGGIIAASLDLDMVEKISAPNVQIPDLAALSADQRQKFIDGVPLDELTGKLKSFGQETKELMFGVGEDLVTGLIRGTLDMGDILKRFLLGFASRFILGPLAGALGIFSPSRLTTGFGVELGAGFVKGMGRMEPAVKGAALSLASVAVQAPSMATRTSAASATMQPASTATTTADNRPLNIYLPDPWADPTVFARSPAGQRYFRVADDTAAQMGHRRG